MALLNTKPDYNVNYDYTDIAAGTGIQRYYAASLSGANFTTSQNILTDQVIRGGQTCYVKYYDPAGTGWESLPAVNFDLYFNLPRIIKGNAVVNITTGCNAYTDGGNQETKATIVLQKYDGTTATDIISGVTSIQKNDNIPAQAYASRQHSVIMAVPKTKFKRGEYLRMSVRQEVKNNSGDPMYWGFGIDPYNTADVGNDPTGRRLIFASEATILTLDLPFQTGY